jgi:hypothetical protein
MATPLKEVGLGRRSIEEGKDGGGGEGRRDGVVWFCYNASYLRSNLDVLMKHFGRRRNQNGKQKKQLEHIRFLRIHECKKIDKELATQASLHVIFFHDPVKRIVSTKPI